MLALKSGKNLLDLDPKTSVSLQYTTPILDTDNIGRAFSFDFDLPDTPINVAEFKHPQRLEKSILTPTTTQILLENLPLMKGKLTVVDTKKSIKVQFTNKSRDILDELNYDLSTFAQETINIYTQGPVVGIQPKWGLNFITEQFTAGLPNYCYISINGHRFSVIAFNWSPPLNEDLDAEYERLTNAINAHFGQNIAEYDTFWQQIRITYPDIMDFVIEDKISVTPLYSVAEYESQRNVVGVDALIAGNTFVFPYIHVPNYYPSNNIFKYYPNVNKGALTHITANEWADKKEDFRNSLAPGVRLSYILGKIATRLKLKLSGDWWAEPEAKRLFFWTGLTLDEVVEEENGGVKRYINRWRKSFQTGEFLPDITAKELLQMLSKNFGVYYKVVNDKLILEKKKTLYQRKSRDFTPYLLPESLRFEPYTGKGIKLSYNFDKEATIPPDQLQPLSIGDAATAYTLDMITLPMVGFRFKKPQYWEKENTKANILLFDRATNSLFRDAASDNKNAEGVIIPGAWSLAFEGTAGLYRLHLKDIAELVNESKATALFDLPSEELTALQRGDYVRIHANTPNGTLRAVIKTISIKPSVQDLGFAEIEMLRI